MRGLIILFAILLIGCSPEKRLTRLTTKYPHLIASKDSFQVKVIPALYTDTTKVTNKIDSFVVTNRDVITKIFRYYDTITVNQEFPQVSDTIHYYHETKLQVAKDDTWRLFGIFDVIHLILSGCLILIVVIIVAFAFLKR